MNEPNTLSRLARRSRSSFQSMLGSAASLFPCPASRSTTSRYLPYRPSEESPPWYREDEDISVHLSDDMRQFYLEYINLEGAALEKRLCEIRDRAWKLGNWPTFGSWIFAQGILRSHPYYPQLVADLKRGAVLLEAGCGLGQDLRYLAHNGAPTVNMIAVDEVRELWELGKALFSDVDDDNNDQPPTRTHPHPHPPPAFKARLIEASLTDLTYSFTKGRNKRLRQTVDIVMANNFFNVAVNRVTSGWAMDSLMPCTKPGTIFLGYHIAPDENFLSEENMYYYSREGLLEDVFNAPHRCADVPDDARWEEVVYNTVDLQSWGLERRDWSWIRDCRAPDTEPQLRGAFFVMRRMR